MTKTKKKTPTLKYTELKLKEALKAIEDGSPVATVSKTYNIPRTTLRYKKNGILRPVIQRRGPSCILGEDVEARLVEWIIVMSTRGFPVAKYQLLNSIKLLLREMKRKEEVFKKNTPGRSWYDSFKERHPELCEKLSQNLQYSRACLNEESIRKWFKEVEEQFEKEGVLDLDASRIFNCDESSFLLAPKGGTVLVEKGNKTAYSYVKNDSKECLTTLFCGNAAGQLIPPMVLFKYQKIPRRISAEFPKDWAIGHTDNGWETAKSFSDWISIIFYKWLIANKIQFPVILYVDGHLSHLTYSLSRFCKEKRIILTALHPNATHILQPLDVAVFKPLKAAWTKVVLDWRFENNGDRLPYEKFGGLMKKAIDTLNWESILKNGFRATGLHPFSVESINYEKFFKGSKPPPVTPASQQENSTVDALKVMESHIGEDVLRSFRESEEEWMGDLSNRSLFYVWRKMKGLENNLTSDNVYEEQEDDSTRTPSQQEETNYENQSWNEFFNDERTSSVSSPIISDSCITEADLSEFIKTQEPVFFEISKDGELVRVADEGLEDTMRVNLPQVQSQTPKRELQDILAESTEIDNERDEIEFEKVSEPIAEQVIMTPKRSNYDDQNSTDENIVTADLSNLSDPFLDRQENDTQNLLETSDIKFHEQSKVQPEEELATQSTGSISSNSKQEKTPKKEDTSYPISNFPSPFKRALVVPDPARGKGKRAINVEIKAKMPSVAVSADWEIFHEAKQALKSAEDAKKAERALERARIKIERVNVQQLKRKNREIARADRQMRKEKQMEEIRMKKARREAKKLKDIANKEAKLLKKNDSIKSGVRVKSEQEDVISNESPICAKEIKRELIDDTGENESDGQSAIIMPKKPEE